MGTHIEINIYVCFSIATFDYHWVIVQDTLWYIWTFSSPQKSSTAFWKTLKDIRGNSEEISHYISCACPIQNLLIYIQSFDANNVWYHVYFICFSENIANTKEKVPTTSKNISQLAPLYSCTGFLPSWRISFGSCHHVPRLMHQPPTIHRVKQKRSARLDFSSLRVERGHSFRRSSQFFPFQMDWGNSNFAPSLYVFRKSWKKTDFFQHLPQCWAKFLNFQHGFSRRSSPSLVHIPRTRSCLGFIHSIPFPSVFVGENHV